MSHIPTNHYCRCYSWRFSLHPALCNHLISSLAASNRASSANLLSRYSGRQVSLCFSTNAMISSWRDKAPAILGDCWGGRPRFGFHVALGSSTRQITNKSKKKCRSSTLLPIGIFNFLIAPQNPDIGTGTHVLKDETPR